MARSQQDIIAAADQVIERYKEQVARQVKSIDRLLDQVGVLKADLAERSERVRELEAALADCQGGKENDG